MLAGRKPDYSVTNVNLGFYEPFGRLVELRNMAQFGGDLCHAAFSKKPPSMSLPALKMVFMSRPHSPVSMYDRRLVSYIYFAGIIHLKYPAQTRIRKSLGEIIKMSSVA
jgi:hypothetical protein